MKNKFVSQDLLIREMGSSELFEYAKVLEPIPANQKLMKKCIVCYWQLTGKNLLVELNELNEQNT